MVKYESRGAVIKLDDGLPICVVASREGMALPSTQPENANVFSRVAQRVRSTAVSFASLFAVPAPAYATVA